MLLSTMRLICIKFWILSWAPLPPIWLSMLLNGILHRDVASIVPSHLLLALLSQLPIFPIKTSRILAPNVIDMINFVIILKVLCIIFSRSSSTVEIQPICCLTCVALRLLISLSIILDREFLIIDLGVFFYVYLPIFETILMRFAVLLAWVGHEKIAALGIFELLIRGRILRVAFDSFLCRILLGRLSISRLLSVQAARAAFSLLLMVSYGDFSWI